MSTSEIEARLISATGGEIKPTRKRVAADQQQKVEPMIKNFSPAANLQRKLSFKLERHPAPSGIAGASSASCQMNPAICGPWLLQ